MIRKEILELYLLSSGQKLSGRLKGMIRITIGRREK